MNLCLREPDFLRKKNLLPKFGKWTKNWPRQNFLNKLKNLIINFYRICSIITIYNIYYVSTQISYLRLFRKSIPNQDVETTSLCMPQQRCKYLPNATPNDISVERRRDVSVVRLHDVLLERCGDVLKGRNNDVPSVCLHDVSNKSQMKHPTTSQWYVTKTSQWYVSTTFQYYIPTMSPVSPKWYT